ncbi:MAG: flavin reductase family protein [Fretibacterium sp.]|nr:flavin reductase family protein [Fretibacterium sp.]
MKKNIGAKVRGFPTPIILVGTTDENGRHNFATLAWAGICCSEPPSIQISVRLSRHSHAAIIANKAFSVNIPSNKFVVETDFCGIASGRNLDKPATAGLKVEPGPVLGVPLAADFPVSYECRLTHTVHVGSHDLFVGEVVSCLVEESLLNEKDAVQASKMEPLIYMTEDAYYDLGPRLAPSFNVGKALMPGREQGA